MTLVRTYKNKLVVGLQTNFHCCAFVNGPVYRIVLYSTKNLHISPGPCAASFTAANPGTGDPFEMDRCPNKDAKAPAAPALNKHKFLKINSLIFSRVE